VAILDPRQATALFERLYLAQTGGLPDEDNPSSC